MPSYNVIVSFLNNFLAMQRTILAAALLLLLGAGCTGAATVEPDTNTNADVKTEVENEGGDGLIDIDTGDDITDIYTGDGLIDIDTEIQELYSGETDASARSFTITARNFAFTPSTMTVKKGDVVTITLVNGDGFHDFVLEAFDVRSSRLQTDASETVTFVADQTGTFEYYCSVGEHRAMGMKGTLTVTE